MAISDDLLQILVCPLCKSPLIHDASSKQLRCTGCPRSYPIRDDIPVMLVDEADVDESRVEEFIPNIRTRPRASENAPSVSTPFSATYFPWSVIQNEATLKRALLYFDTVNLLAPPTEKLDEVLEEFAREDPTYARRPREFKRPIRQKILEFYGSIKTLRSCGVIKTLDSNSLVSQPGVADQLIKMTFDDSLDYEANETKFYLSELDQMLDSNVTGSIAHESDGRDAVAFHYWEGTQLKAVYSTVLDKVTHYVDSLPKTVQLLLSNTLKLPDAVIRSLLLNTSLLCIQEAGSIPILDSPADARYLLSKYRRIFDAERNPDAGQNVKSIQEFVAKVSTKSGMLANYILEIAVPNLEVQSIEDILEIRERFKDHLQLFRLKMVTLASEIKTTIADREFVEHCENIVAKDILPVVLDLQKRIQLSNLRVLREFVKNVASLKPTIPFVLSAFTPLPLYSAALVAAGIVSLDTALNLYLDRKDLLHNNGLAYLLDVQQGDLRVDDSLWNRSAALAAKYGV